MSTSQHNPSTERISGIETLQAGIEYPIRFLAFWTAVVVPFVLLGLIAVGLAQQSPLLLGGLLTANVSGLVIGRDYKR